MTVTQIGQTELSENFKLGELVSKATIQKWGDRAIWFVDPRVVELAEFYKKFFFDYYKDSKSRFGELVDVQIIVNTWLWGGDKVARGYRDPKEYHNGQFSKTPFSESAHRQSRAFDCDIVLVYKAKKKGAKPKKVECNYVEIHKIIQDNAEEFYAAGLRRVESVRLATTWLHSDIYNTGPEMVDKILVVG